MRFLIAALVAGLFLSGCATSNFQRYGSIDRSQKTITVAPGSFGLNGRLKQVLAKHGWKLVVYRGPAVTEGKIGKNTKIKQYDSFNSRYTLVVNSRRYDLCLNFTPMILYDVSLIDNRSGSEVFTMDGDDCESSVVQKFKEALKNRV